MLQKIGADVIVSSGVEDIKKAKKLILPGVGAFDNGMKNLNNSGLLSILNDRVLKEKIPVLGICLGMQLFTRKSEEGTLSGLGWIDGEAIRFRVDPVQKDLKIPHMGWDTVAMCKQSALFDDMYQEPRFYFVHSYHVACNDKNDILTKTSYGYDFVSSLQRENILGVQFHPEKSHKFGMKLLKNFVDRF
ncbi:MAG: Imidazole glycerol phosphate synthase amidotransferase subunit [Candidatus Jettenia ecosi]|uniref:Imidazole glycerol phosphate synthase amidotransferase subunit n=1 Tax=Candidatus Jettenia ecosi TaxID=2494326 RepID=A0A533Q8E7_9BACT|nr:MAG: Imidazole glycerol phosphate synthase amidotransferase subunit [Candidatus Jettenia ecosi]